MGVFFYFVHRIQFEELMYFKFAIFALRFCFATRFRQHAFLVEILGKLSISIKYFTRVLVSVPHRAVNSTPFIEKLKNNYFERRK